MKQFRDKFLFILIPLLVIISCQSRHIRLKGEINDEYDFKYIGDTIFWGKRDLKTNESSEDKLIKIDNEYYFVIKTDTFLYLSTKKDTSYLHSDDSEHYKIEIKKINPSLYSTTNYYVQESGFYPRDKHYAFLTCIYYDNNYNITRFEVSSSINYTSDSK